MRPRPSLRPWATRSRRSSPTARERHKHHRLHLHHDGETKPLHPLRAVCPLTHLPLRLISVAHRRPLTNGTTATRRNAPAATSTPILRATTMLMRVSLSAAILLLTGCAGPMGRHSDRGQKLMPCSNSRDPPVRRPPLPLLKGLAEPQEPGVFCHSHPAREVCRGAN